MITKEVMFDLVWEACPSFSPDWKDQVGAWIKPIDEMSLYGAVVEWARFVAKLDDAVGQRDALNALELWMTKGEPFVQSIATIGVLAELRRLSRAKYSEALADLAGLMGPETRYWWSKVAESEANDLPLFDDRPKRLLT